MSDQLCKACGTEKATEFVNAKGEPTSRSGYCRKCLEKAIRDTGRHDGQPSRRWSGGGYHVIRGSRHLS